jgi:hypothetical protein
MSGVYKVPDFPWGSGGPKRNSMWMMGSRSDEAGVKFHLFEAMNECTEASVRSLKIVDRGAAEKAKKDTFWAVCFYRPCSIKDDGNGKKEVVEDSPDSASVTGKFKSDQTMTVVKRDLGWKKVQLTKIASGLGLFKFQGNSKKNALDWVRTWAETTQDASSEEDAHSDDKQAQEALLSLAGPHDKQAQEALLSLARHHEGPHGSSRPRAITRNN